MGIGSGIFIFVVGLILAFALNVQVSWIDLKITGYILMGAGLVVFVISLAFALRRRPQVSTRRERVDPATGERVERRTDEY
jgi:membrane-bound ClpP family serine protease